MHDDKIVAAKNLCKSFGSFQAVKDLSFEINKGDVYGFLGENGAGKSTTIRMLLGLIFPDSGEIYIKGERFDNSKRHLLQHIGAIIERPDMYLYLSGWDNLKLFARLSMSKIPDTRLKEVLDIVGLSGREEDKAGAYSQGMKQRLGIAIAMVHNPELLILDEPTNGLDPQGIVEMRKLIQTLSKDFGKTILISSHLLYEIEQIATRMVIIHKGQKKVEGRVAELLDPKETLLHIKIGDVDNAEQIIKNSQWGNFLQGYADNDMTLKMSPDNIPVLNEWLVAQGIPVYEIKTRHSLETYFLSLTNDGHA